MTDRLFCCSRPLRHPRFIQVNGSLGSHRFHHASPLARHVSIHYGAWLALYFAHRIWGLRSLGCIRFAQLLRPLRGARFIRTRHSLGYDRLFRRSHSLWASRFIPKYHTLLTCCLGSSTVARYDLLDSFRFDAHLCLHDSSGVGVRSLRVASSGLLAHSNFVDLITFLHPLLGDRFLGIRISLEHFRFFRAYLSLHLYRFFFGHHSLEVVRFFKLGRSLPGSPMLFRFLSLGCCRSLGTHHSLRGRLALTTFCRSLMLNQFLRAQLSLRTCPPLIFDRPLGNNRCHRRPSAHSLLVHPMALD